MNRSAETRLCVVGMALTMTTFLSGCGADQGSLDRSTIGESSPSLPTSDDSHPATSWPEDFVEVVDDLVADCPSLTPDAAAAQIDLQSDAIVISEAIHDRFPATYSGWEISPCGGGVVMKATDTATVVAIEALAADSGVPIVTELVESSYEELADAALEVQGGMYEELLGSPVMAQVDVGLNRVGVWAPHADPDGDLPVWLVVSARYAPGGDVPELVRP